MTDFEQEQFADLRRKSRIQDDLIQAMEAYIELIGNGYDDLAVMAHNRGWRESPEKIESGLAMRLRISDLRTSLDELRESDSSEEPTGPSSDRGLATDSAVPS